MPTATKSEPVVAPEPTAPVSVPEQGEPVIEEKSSEKTAGAKAAPPVEQTAAQDAASELKLEIMDWAQAEAITTAHPGKVVVIDLWATYCVPCLKELPGLVALQNKYPNEVHCVSVSLDYEGDPDAPPTKLEPDVRQALERVKAHKVQNILLSTAAEDVFTLTKGAIPIVFVYDQTGKRVHTFPDRKAKQDDASYERDIIPAVEALLKASPSK